MIHPQQLQHLTEANTALHNAWQDVIKCQQAGNPIETQHATMRYLQVLQMVYEAAQVAVAGK